MQHAGLYTVVVLKILFAIFAAHCNVSVEYFVFVFCFFF